MSAPPAHTGSSAARSRLGTRQELRPPREPTGAARRSPRGHPATLVALSLVAIFLVSGWAGAAPAHVATTPTGNGVVSSDIVAAAHRSAARGEGPGALPTPSLASHPALSPNTTYSLQMSYDPIDGYVVAVTPAYSGDVYNTTYGPNEVTWIYSAGTWSVVNTTGAPPELLYPALTYDAVDEYVVLFGGLQVAGSTGYVSTEVSSDQTWSYVGGAWTNRTSASAIRPPADAIPQLTYDGADSYVFLLDETANYPQTMVPTSWAYARGTWTNVTGPSGAAAPPLQGVLAFDAADHYVVYFGALASGPGVENWWSLNVTWTYQAGNWTNVTSTVTGAPSGRIFAGITYDPTMGKIVLFGGIIWRGPLNYSFANDTWAYAGGAWTNLGLTTPGTTWYIVGLVYDAGSSELVLAGEGSNTTHPAMMSIVWVLASGGWAPAMPALLLDGIGADAGTPFDLAVRTVPLAGPLTYQYRNLPPGCSSSNTPLLSCNTTTPGRFAVEALVTDDALATTVLSTLVVVNPRPVVTFLTADGPVAEVGIPFHLAASAVGGTGSLTLAYAGLPTGCASANASTLTCTPTAPGTASVRLQATDALGVSDSMSTSVWVAPRPSLTTFAVTPAVVDVGQAVVVAMLTAGGVGPVQFGYAGLPSVCAPTGGLSFRCVPDSAGAYSISVVATDSFGATTGGVAALTVNSDPTVDSFTASSGAPVVGESVTFSISTLGGTAPYHFLYQGLPVGCASADAPSVTCAVGAPGNSTVIASVFDATGATGNRTLSISVQALPAIVPPRHPAPLVPETTGSSATVWVLAAVAVGLVGVGLYAARQRRIRREGDAIFDELRRRSDGPGAEVSDARPPR